MALRMLSRPIFPIFAGWSRAVVCRSMLGCCRRAGQTTAGIIPANISDICGLVASGRLPIDVVLLQASGPDDAGRYNAGLGIEHLHAAIGQARLVITQINPELPSTCGDTVIDPGVIYMLVPAREPRWRS